MIDKTALVIYLAIAAVETKKGVPFNMGFSHPQTGDAGCYITDLVLN